MAEGARQMNNDDISPQGSLPSVEAIAGAVVNAIVYSLSYRTDRSSSSSNLNTSSRLPRVLAKDWLRPLLLIIGHNRWLKHLHFHLLQVTLDQLRTKERLTPSGHPKGLNIQHQLYSKTSEVDVATLRNAKKQLK